MGEESESVVEVGDSGISFEFNESRELLGVCGGVIWLCCEDIERASELFLECDVRVFLEAPDELLFFLL